VSKYRGLHIKTKRKSKIMMKRNFVYPRRIFVFILQFRRSGAWFIEIKPKGLVEKKTTKEKKIRAQI
jgi:hypothetical protein